MRTFLLICLAFLAVSIQAPCQIEVEFDPGFNMISINVIPSEDLFSEDEDRGPNLPLMFEQLRGEDGQHAVILVIDENGNLYSPGFNFCRIRYWNLTQGLIVQVEEPTGAVWEGERIPPDTDIPIDRWASNIIAYYPTYVLNANADDFYVLSPIIDQVQWARDDHGRFMMPEFNFSNMNPWREGEAYLIVTDEDVVLNYPEERDEEPVIFENGIHWEMLINARTYMPLLLSSITGPEGFEPGEGDQVGAFGEDGEYVGCGDVRDGMCGIGVIGVNQRDDFGLQHGEEFTLLYWDADRGEEYNINVEEAIHWHEGLRFHQSCRMILGVSVDADIPYQSIALNRGWNIISLNVEPPEEMWEREDGPDIESIVNQLVEDDILILMKDEIGRFFSTEFNFNNIPYWNLTEGYQVNVNQETEFVCIGNSIPPDREIPIEEGWNLIAYFPDYILNAEAEEFYVLSPIIDYVIIAKNDQGEFLSPEFGFSNMPPWEPGQGYQIDVNADVVLQYPEEREEEVAFTPPSPPLQSKGGKQGYWTGITPTDNNMSVLVSSISGIDHALESKITAYTTNDQLVGIGYISDGKCGIAVWGSETVKHGLQPGQPFELRLWDAGKDCETDLSVTSLRKGTGLVYEVDGFTVMDVSVTSTSPDDYFLSELFPNPFNNRASVKYGLPENGKVDLAVYNLSGRRVMELIIGEHSAGVHEMDINCTGLTSGIYILSLNTGKMKFTQKLILVK